MAKKLTTLLEIIKYSATLLSEKNIKDSRLNVELMFCEILNCDRIKLYIDFDKPLKQDEILRFKTMLKKRMNFEPLQYILGKTNFYGYTIKLNNKVLIPRQETEILVDKVLGEIYKTNPDKICMLEIGTGSGCIAIALSKELSKKNIKHNIIAIDISEDILEVAKSNALLNNIPEANLEFKCIDFLKEYNLKDNFDYIVANPPYIPIKEIENLDIEVRNYEPISALSDGNNGLLFYDNVFKFYKNNSGNSKIFLEIGDGQRFNVEELLNNHNIKDYFFFKDYCNIDRVLKIN